MNLSPEQKAAAITDSPQSLVVASAGSGKTRTLIARIESLLSAGATADRICAITFTNAGAAVMRDRLPGVILGHTGTIHALMLKLIRKHHRLCKYQTPPSVLSEEAAEELARDVFDEMKVKGVTFAQMLEEIAEDEPVVSRRMSGVELLARSYFMRFRESGLIDFNGLLFEGLKLIQKYPGVIEFDHLLVDEVQDSGDLDWNIYQAMPCKTKWLCGDDSQSIFGFRGASVKRMIQFGRDQATVFSLSTNYRSGMDICTASMRLIKHNTERLPNEMVAQTKESGEVTYAECPDEAVELEHVAKSIRAACNGDYSECAVLLRTNWLVERFTKGLASYSIPVAKPERGEQKPADWRTAKALVAALADLDNEMLAYNFVRARFGKDRADAMRSENIRDMKPFTLPTHLGSDFTLSQRMGTVGLSAASQDLVHAVESTLPEDYTLADLSLAMHAEPPQKMTPGVTICTGHAAKGREWNVVFLSAFEQGVIPSKQSLADDLEGERRLAYVMLTRARHHVGISWSRERKPSMPSWAHPVVMQPSQFIKEMQ